MNCEADVGYSQYIFFVLSTKNYRDISGTFGKRMSYTDRNRFVRKSDPWRNKRTGWALSFRDVSRYFSTIEFPIHVNPIAVVRSLHRRQYVGIKKSVRGALSRGSGLSPVI